MKISRFIFILCVPLMILFSVLTANGTAGNSEIQKPDDNGFLSILALNYCHNSLYNIIEYNDRIVLDDEYNNIISNINLTKIPYNETIQVIKQLMDILTEFKLSEKEKDKLYAIYEKQGEKALTESIKPVITVASTVGVALAAQQYTTAAKSALELKDVYTDYREKMDVYKQDLDDAIWILEKEALHQINEMNKTFLETYWKLLYDYKGQDRWRITLKDLKNYMNVMKEESVEKKCRKLKRLESDFSFFPPYWYSRLTSAQEISEKVETQKSLEKYL